MTSPATTILMLGTFDSKRDEFTFLHGQLTELGCDVVSMNVGVMETDVEFEVHISAREVAEFAGHTIESLRADNDRGKAMSCMSEGAANAIRDQYKKHPFHAVIGMGGSGGTNIVTAAMRALPLGIPKICVSTVASTDTSPYVGSKDIVLIPSITDISGLNRVSRRVIAQAAGAISGMANATQPTADEDRPIIVATMFGNTTDCVTQCREQLDHAGNEVLVFHAVGSGGRTMETLINDGMADACLDITTTEWSDQLCGGIFAAGEDRLSAAGRRGIPHLIAPGCIDMVNFGPMNTVPERYRNGGRHFYEWNPSVTLMRTNADENRRLGSIFAQKANAATGPVAFLLPLRGVSILDGDGERFCDREADHAMFDALKANLRSDIPIIEIDANINDAVFAQTAVDTMLEWMQQLKLDKQH